MRISVNWLRDWVDIDQDAPHLAELLTTAGLEVDSVLPAGEAFDGVVVGEILACEAHPDADRLRVCQVDDGQGRATVVCGAPNARVGLRTAFARVGAHLPGNAEIAAVKVRGIDSAGMLCSARELGLSDDGSGIVELPRSAPLGADLRDFLGLEDDVLDVDLTPNRGDCFCVMGIAREIAAACRLPIPEATVAPVAPAISDTFPARIDAPEACPRFVARIIRNIGITTSPIWLVERLRRSGIRAIHPVVDVTNYVMLELGQPLHGYDLRQLDGEIGVRFGSAGEKLELLDGREIELADDVVVIADKSGPIGMAGIMGGQSSAVRMDSTDILLEAAFFPPGAISGRARRYGLHTDASMRFERGVDPAQQVRAIERATGLLLEIAGGDPGPVIEVVVPEHLPSAGSILLRGSRITGLLGYSVAPEVIEETLEQLGIGLEAEEANVWRATPPSYRFDLSIEEDLIEEIARRIGYESIPAIPEFTASKLGTASEHRVEDDRLIDLLVGRGYSETICYSFVDPTLAGAVNPDCPSARLANPISSDLSVLRQSLWPGLLTVAVQNLSRQQHRLRLFEVGTRFEVGGQGGVVEQPTIAGLVCGSRWPEHWDDKSVEADFYDVKQDVEALLALSGRADETRFSPAEHPALWPGRCATIELNDSSVGWIGVLHPSIQQSLDIRFAPILFSLDLEKITVAKVPAFEHYPKFPSIRRDLSIVVRQDISAATVIGSVRKVAGSRLQNIDVFDVYRGPGIDSSRKSIGLGLILQDTYRTLTDEDADQTVATVVEYLGSELGATIRN